MVTSINSIAGIITLTTAVRHPGPISVVTDWAPGFVSISKSDKDLNSSQGPTEQELQRSG